MTKITGLENGTSKVNYDLTDLAVSNSPTELTTWKHGVFQYGLSNSNCVSNLLLTGEPIVYDMFDNIFTSKVNLNGAKVLKVIFNGCTVKKIIHDNIVVYQ